ncbi:MAG: response regulator transcription factor [Alistipes sp.]|jgi:two-component system alkaline phosphatase synthesis response regulator PhoP|nr:response regulator transcription factor [Alistipes sp.]
MTYRILIVDDEPDILEFVGYNLKKEGFEVQTATNGRQAVDRTLAWHPHLILLDAMMPIMDGYEACRLIRTTKGIDDTLVIFLTARGDENSQVKGFDVGADDYIAKPIQLKALTSRIRAVLKRKDYNEVSDETIMVDAERHMVTRGGEEVVLPRKEFSLLSLLHSVPGKLFTREEIYDTVWGTDIVVGDRTIDVHIRNLRKKIGDRHIITIKGVGYKYED